MRWVGVDAMVDRWFDAGGPSSRGHHDAGDELRAVYRAWGQNILIAGVFIVGAVVGCASFAGDAGAFELSRRVPLAIVLASGLVARALRRAVIVSPFGLEARRTFTTWRVPWSAVESYRVIGRPNRAPSAGGELNVVLVDGSNRSAQLGPTRPGEPPFPEVAAASQRHARVRSRGYLNPNWPLQLLILGGIALLVACAVAELGREEYRYRAGRLSTTAKELADLQSQIDIGDGFALAISGFVAVAGVAAVVWSRRSRGVAPIGYWPARFPDDFQGGSWPPPAVGGERAVGSLPPPFALPCPSRLFDIPSVVRCRADGVFRADGTMLAAISHRKVAWTKVDQYTYWTARGLSAFSADVVQLPVDSAGEAPSTGGRWLIPGLTTPHPVYFDAASDDSGVVLHVGGAVACRLIADQRAHLGGTYAAVDDEGRTLATLERSMPGWTCEMSSDVPMTTRRLLCVAALWAERRYSELRSSS